MIHIMILGVTLADRQQSQKMLSFPKKPGFWTYEGSLIDPVNGQRIANIVGIEHFQSLIDDGQTTPTPTATGALVVPSSRWKNIPHECFRSRKVFCYTDNDQPLHDGTVQKPLQSYKRRANGPPRPVPLDQSVIVSESTVCYLANGKCLYTEFANGKSAAWGRIETTAPTSSRHDDDSSRRLKVFTTPLLPRQMREEDLLQRIANLQESYNNGAATSAGTTTPRRHSIVQFGGMGSSSSGGRSGPPRGVRETYEYRDNIVSYTRYGEGPVWYGLGRMAQLELTGRHYDYIMDDNDDPIAAQRQSVPIPTVLADFIPRNFWSRTNLSTTTSIDGSDPFPMARQQQQQQQNPGSTIAMWLTRLRSATSFSVGGHDDP
jgi:hypothetical protein